MMQNPDLIVVGAGIAGLVAACEAADRGQRVLVLDQEGEQNLGGQAFWSLGGMLMIDTPEQRRMGVKDSYELAYRDWMGSARFDRDEDHWPKLWAEAYLKFASGEMRDWLKGLGVSWLIVPGWAERGGATADGHGNSVPRFHIPWGTGVGALEPFRARARDHERDGRLSFGFRHRVTGLESGTVRGDILEGTDVSRGATSSRKVVDTFEHSAGNILIASGGVGGNLEKVRAHWPVDRLGPAPGDGFISGVPEHVDGHMLDVVVEAGGRLINQDRMWHYCEGIRNWDPIWPKHAIRVLPGPSPIWFDAFGERLTAPDLPGFNTLSSLERISRTGHHYSWFILNQSIIKKEFALSGSEQNPDMTEGGPKDLIKERLLNRKATGPVEAFKKHGEDFVIADDLDQLLAGMNKLAEADANSIPFDAAKVKAAVLARDAQLDNKFGKDMQIAAIKSARKYLGDRLMRTTKPHKITDPQHGPMIGVRLSIMSRKTLGGLNTNLDGQVLNAAGEVIPGLWAAGEAAGFGGGGYHGYAVLEGTFIGGCLFTGRVAGRNV